MGHTALNVSIATCGLATARQWLELGYDFNEMLQNGDNNVLLAIEFDFVPMLEFLQCEAGISLYVFNLGGQSSLELSIEKASFKCFCYLVDYYIDFAVFEVYEDFGIIERLLSQLMQALSGNLFFTTNKAVPEALNQSFNDSIESKLTPLSFRLC